MVDASPQHQFYPGGTTSDNQCFRRPEERRWHGGAAGQLDKPPQSLAWASASSSRRARLGGPTARGGHVQGELPSSRSRVERVERVESRLVPRGTTSRANAENRPPQTPSEIHPALLPSWTRFAAGPRAGPVERASEPLGLSSETSEPFWTGLRGRGCVIRSRASGLMRPLDPLPQNNAPRTAAPAWLHRDHGPSLHSDPIIRPANRLMTKTMCGGRDEVKRGQEGGLDATEQRGRRLERAEPAMGAPGASRPGICRNSGALDDATCFAVLCAVYVRMMLSG